MNRGTCLRRLKVSLVLIALTITLAACEGDLPLVNRSSITVYTALPPDLVQRYLAAFEEEHPEIEVTLVSDDTLKLTDRLLAERGNPRADVIWGLAVLGIGFNLFLVNRPKALSAAVYLAMGWIILIAIKPMFEALPLAGVIWVVAGGVAYSAGITFYLWKRLPYHHAIWHPFVLAGSILHFFAVLLYVLPMDA